MISYNNKKHIRRNNHLNNASTILFIIGCFTIIPIPLAIHTSYKNRKTKNTNTKYTLNLAKLQTSTINSVIFIPIVLFALHIYATNDPKTYLTMYILAFSMVPILSILITSILAQILYKQRMHMSDSNPYTSTAKDIQWATPIGLIVNMIALIIGTIHDKWKKDHETEQKEEFIKDYKDDRKCVHTEYSEKTNTLKNDRNTKSNHSNLETIEEDEENEERKDMQEPFEAFTLPIPQKPIRTFQYTSTNDFNYHNNDLTTITTIQGAHRVRCTAEIKLKKPPKPSPRTTTLDNCKKNTDHSNVENISEIPILGNATHVVKQTPPTISTNQTDIKPINKDSKLENTTHDNDETVRTNMRATVTELKKVIENRSYQNPFDSP